MATSGPSQPRAMSEIRMWKDRVLSVAKIANGLDSGQVDYLPLLVEGSKTFLRNYALKVISEAGRDAVIMVQRSCDCIPLKVWQRLKLPHGQSTVRASGKETIDYFVAVVYVTVLDAGVPCQHALVFRVPTPLTNGKSMPSLLASMLSAPGMLLGTSDRQAITLHHQIHDRGIFLDSGLLFRHR